MARDSVITATGTTITHDETAGLQNNPETPMSLGTPTTTTFACRRSVGLLHAAH